MNGLKKNAQWLVVILAMLLPFIIIRSFPKFYHTSDMDDFRQWSQAWEMDWRSVYVNCERCNYPFLGTFLSGGVMSAIDIENFLHLAKRFQYYLAALDALNILVVWLILKNLQVKHAPMWAGIIGLLPSSWLGSSVWGQIDGAGQLLILLFYLLLIWFNQEKRSPRQFYGFAALAGLLLSFMLLTKQLIYFSAFALGVVFVANVFLYSRKPAHIITSGAIALLTFVLPVIIIDMNLDLKAPYFSHLQYILATGSGHGDIISSTGFNIWVFFSDDLLGSSRLPLPVKMDSQTLFSVTPFITGIFLFLLFNVALIFTFARQIFKDNLLDEWTSNRRFILMSFVYLALVNLGFNLMLTGAHERYLYHFYPFVIIACLAYLGGSRFFNRTMLTALIAGALVYGTFLFGYLNRWVIPTSLSALRWMSGFHLLLFCFLIYAAFRQFNSQISDSPSQP